MPNKDPRASKSIFLWPVKKTSSEVLNHINDFIGHYGEPKILQYDHGKEFDNNLLKNYCKERNINLIFAGVRHPTTNGVVEVVHKDILNSLLSEKLEKKINSILNLPYPMPLVLIIITSTQSQNIHQSFYFIIIQMN